MVVSVTVMVVLVTIMVSGFMDIQSFLVIKYLIIFVSELVCK